MAAHEAFPGGAPATPNTIVVEAQRMDQLHLVPAPRGEEHLASVTPLAIEAPHVVDSPRHASAEVAVESDYVGRHREAAQAGPRHAAPEDTTYNTSRLSVRVAERVAGFATRVADNMGNRRTAREVARDRIERGREGVRKVGASVVESAVTTSDFFGDVFESAKETSVEGVSRFRGFLRGKAEAARNHKNNLVAAVRTRKEQIGGAVRSTAETAKEKSVHAAKVGGEVLKVSGLVALGTGVIAAEAIGKGAKYGAQKTAEGARYAGEGVKQGAVKTAEKTRAAGRATKEYAGREVAAVRAEVNDLRAGSKEFGSQRAERKAAKIEAKAERKAAKFEAKRAQRVGRAAALATRAAELRDRN